MDKSGKSRRVAHRLTSPAPHSQIGLREAILLVFASTLILAYVESYYRLSRRGMREAEGMAFLYISAEETADPKNDSRHYLLLILYRPINRLDRAIHGGSGPSECLMRLKGGK